MRYKPMPLPRSPGGPYTLVTVVDVGGQPYAVFAERSFDERNNRADMLHLVEFEEVE